MYQTFRNLLGERALQTMLLFGIFALIGWNIDSPWWEGKFLKISPEIPEPTGGFVEKSTDEKVKKKVAEVELAPTVGQGKQKWWSGDTPSGGEPGGDSGGGPGQTGIYQPLPSPVDYQLLERVRTLESKLEKPPVKLRRPCQQWYSDYLTDGVEPVCRRRAMDGFFAHLRRVALKQAERPIRYSQFGDSLIAGDGFTGELRRLLHSQFGDGGFGYIHMGKASQYIGTRHLTTRTSEEWSVTNVIRNGPGGGRFGFAGVAFEPDGNPTLGIYPHGEGNGRAYDRLGVLYWRKARNLSLQMRLDGESRTLDLSGPPRTDALTWVDVGEGTHRLRLSGFDPRGVYYGVILENSGPGAVVDNLGLMNGRVPRLSLIEDAIWQRHIRLRNPDVASFAYGVNSAGPHRARQEWYDAYSQDYAGILETVRQADEDGVDCLVVSALTRGTLEGDDVRIYPSLRPLIRAQKEAARDAGCGFWNAFQAIGGAEGVDQWYHNDPQLLGSDFSHPTRTGYTRLANLFYASLIEAFRHYLEERVRRASVLQLRDLHVDELPTQPTVPTSIR